MKHVTSMVGALLLLMASGPIAPTVIAGETGVAAPTTASALDAAVLAGRYEAEAQALRREADEHRAMKERYEKMPHFQKGRPGVEPMTAHCDRIIAALEQAAAESEAMAKAVRAQAESAN